MTKILFIINPISGTIKKNKVEEKIELFLDKSFEKKIIYTNAPKHATQIANENSMKYNIIVAVGGDGTINEISRGLINKNAAMGIIPLGSGNGLARHLKIPLNVKKAIKIINNYNVKLIDAVKINEEYFVNVAGFGFDSYVAHLFANNVKRGFWSYVKIIFTKVFKYKPPELNVIIDNKTIKSKDFIFSLANSSQYGNNAQIAPKANLSDGLIDVIFQKKINIFNAPFFLFRMMTGKLNENKNYSHFKTSSIKINTKNKNIFAHIDGDPVIFENNINVNVIKQSVKIVI